MMQRDPKCYFDWEDKQGGWREKDKEDNLVAGGTTVEKKTKRKYKKTKATFILLCLYANIQMTSYFITFSSEKTPIF